MRLVTLSDGRTARVENDGYAPLPGMLVDHLCRAPAKPSGALVPFDRVTLGPPIRRPGKIVCLGRNYADHARESGNEPPKSPILFAKASSSIVGPGDPIEKPPGDVDLDYEGELAIVIGRAGRRVTVAEAPSLIGGYACFNDVSDRRAQQGDGQWFRGKSNDTFAPFGPWVVTPDEVGDPDDLRIRSLVNAEVRQDSTTAHMLVGVADIVSFCSHAFSLEPGDIIATGTPPGVGLRDGRYLAVGDTVTVEVEGLGSLTNRVVD